jgi:NhaA family Na+:H+ antiporter
MKAEMLLPASGPAVASRRGAFRQLWHFATEHLLALPLGAAVALAWANAADESYYRATHAIAFAVNDVAMVFFFALMTKEVVEATAPGGVLHSWRRVLLPVVASAGVALAPLLAFAGLVRVFDEPMLMRGWTVVMATDLAAAYFVARLLFGRHPAVPFMILVAISANALGFAALAAADPIRELRPMIGAPLMAAAIAAALLLRRARVTALWPYAVLGGGLSWSAMYFGGFHPALAALPVVPFLPHAARDPGFFVDAPADATDPLSRLELWCRHPAQAALFLFGLVNAGVPLTALEHGVWSLPLAALVGKPAGLLLGVSLGMLAGLHLPAQVNWRHLVVLGLASAMGFTMALFFATATLGPGLLLSELKMGALLSVGAGALAAAAARLLRVGRFA